MQKYWLIKLFLGQWTLSATVSFGMPFSKKSSFLVLSIMKKSSLKSTKCSDNPLILKMLFSIVFALKVGKYCSGI